MQLLYEGSEESPGVAGLGVLAGRVRRLPAGVKHPQMQWNRLDACGDGSPLLDALAISESEATRRIILDRLRVLGDAIREPIRARIPGAP